MYAYWTVYTLGKAFCPHPIQRNNDIHILNMVYELSHSIEHPWKTSIWCGLGIHLLTQCFHFLYAFKKMQERPRKYSTLCVIHIFFFFCLDLAGKDLEAVQITPVASERETSYIVFSNEVEIHSPLEEMPSGAAIFFEFKHYKPKKGITSTRCFSFMEMDEVKPGKSFLEMWVSCYVMFVYSTSLAPSHIYVFATKINANVCYS